MSSPFRQFGDLLRRLHNSVQSLEEACRLLHLLPVSARPWYRLLENKLLPQAGRHAFLVVAVVGGTNTGKSVVFNHLAGYRASATGPLASGTRHPVCLVPEGFDHVHRLEDVFPGFELRRWTSPDQATVDCSTDLLFWDVASQLPPRLVVLDTPDIDSDVRVNWERAERIWQCSDVLVAVLTQQKYNDAAVKRFFRQAAREDKAVVVVFNQCVVPDDERLWPRWLQTFCSETGVQPELVYLVPFDRQAAERNRLPFRLCQARAGLSDTAGPDRGEPHALRTDLARLHFDEIRLRSLTGALRRLLDRRDGLPAFLDELSGRSDEFRRAEDELRPEQMLVDSWPTVPNRALVRAVRGWWASQRHGWPAKVHAAYDRLAEVVRSVVRRSTQKGVRRSDPLQEYARREREAMAQVLQRMFDRLERLDRSGSQPLRESLSAVLGGDARAELLQELARQHEQLDLRRELDDVVAKTLDEFRRQSPEKFRLLKRLDSVAAAARVTVSVGLFAVGAGPVGHTVVGSVAGSAAHVLVEAAVGAVVAAAGEPTVSAGVGAGVGYVEAKVRGLHEAFARRRAAWLLKLVQSGRLGGVLDDLRRAATVPTTDAFREAERTVHELNRLFGEVRSAPVA